MRVLESAPFAQAFAVSAIGAAFAIPLVRNLIGWPGVAGVLITLVAAAGVVLFAHRRYIEWNGSWPLSIFGFVVWSALSIVWSDYGWWSLAAVMYQVAVLVIGMTIALTRDTIQIVRAVGTALRALLVLSLVIEMLSGIFFDVPFPFLSVQGNLAAGGPIQGVFVTRNMLGLVSVIALITFVIEWRTRSVDRRLAIFSVCLAALCLLFSGSPVNLLLVAVVLAATVALFGLRKSAPERRPYYQAAWLTASLVFVVLLYVFRTRVIDALNAGSEFGVRYRLWRAAWDIVQVHSVEGWGWIGTWNTELFPYTAINAIAGRTHSSSLNAFLDVYLQLGLVGIFLFLVLCMFAFLRAWNLASNRRTVVHTWPALVLVALLVGSAAESSVLTGAFWLLLVVCAAKSSQSMNWRGKLPPRPTQPRTPSSHPERMP